jgi:hypothetical protein
MYFKFLAPKASHVGKCLRQIVREAVNDFCAPSFALLAIKDVTANAPIKGNKFSVYRKSRPNLG